MRQRNNRVCSRVPGSLQAPTDCCWCAATSGGSRSAATREGAGGGRGGGDGRGVSGQSGACLVLGVQLSAHVQLSLIISCLFSCFFSCDFQWCACVWLWLA